MSSTKESFNVEKYQAAPGFVFIEPIQDKGERTLASGLVVPESCDKNPSIVARGTVVSSGEYVTGRADRVLREAGWLKPGTEVQYIPCECWTLRGTDGRTIISIRSQYILTEPKRA